MNRTLMMIPAVALALLIGGCSSTGTGTAPGTDSGATMGGGDSSTGSDGTRTSGTSPWAEYGGVPFNDAGSPLTARVIYFDFDKSEVLAQYQDLLSAHANFLRANPGVEVTLEGHADERGTREYNIGLGERRANAVNDLLTLQGASSSQTSTISYGEEKPAALGHNEASWRLNRRVVLKYNGQ